MAPILVLDEAGEVQLALGSPGGSRIIQYVARTLTDILDHGLDVQAAVSRPNVVSGARLELEDDCGEPALAPEVIEGLEALGHPVHPTSLNSGLQGIQRTETGWIGAVDPRREGEAIAVE
jgi:gamma-glutamyltranspeptidase/glutathione hydrolase